MIVGAPVVWESLNTPGKLFYGRVVGFEKGAIFNGGKVIVRDRNFKQPITLSQYRVKDLSNKNIDTAPRPLLIS